MSGTTQVCSSTTAQTLSLRLTLKPSLLYSGLILACHLLALGGFWFSNVSLPLLIGGSVLIIILCIFLLLRYWQHYPSCLLWDTQGWQLDGCDAVLLRDVSIYPHLINLRFRSGGKTLNLNIWPGNIDDLSGRVDRATLLRRLRFILLNLPSMGGDKDGDKD